MSELKTQVSNVDVSAFIDAVQDEQKKKDSSALLGLFTRITGEQPKMWGSSIIGFGSYHYKSERSSQEGDWPLTGFSPRKQNLTIYFMNGFNTYADLLQELGKHKTSKGCLYINKLSDIELSVLEDLIKDSYLSMQAQQNS